jgi:hypothetical protein
MASDNPADVVERYLDALTRHDDETLRCCLADTGFRYHSPIATFDDPDAFAQFVSMTAGILQRIERRRRFVDGADVCHWLVFVTQLSERTSTPGVQWARVEGGRIVSLELLFDPYHYRQLFDDAEGAAAGR